MRISDTYRDLNLDLHRSNPDYGRAAHALAPWVVEFAQASGARSLLEAVSKGVEWPVSM